MLKPHGQITIAGDIKRIEEYDTISCCHCNAIVRVKPGTAATIYLLDDLVINPVTRVYSIVRTEEPGAACRLCMKAVCLVCHDKGECLPLEKRLEQIERLGRQGHYLGPSFTF